MSQRKRHRGDRPRRRLATLQSLLSTWSSVGKVWKALNDDRLTLTVSLMNPLQCHMQRSYVRIRQKHIAVDAKQAANSAGDCGSWLRRLCVGC